MFHARIVVGLGFGDEGKGSWVDHLVRAYNIKYVVRFGGGAQALHHVVTPEGLVHGFSQFGSGTLVPGTHTCLSRFMLIDPQYLMKEADELTRIGVSSPYSRLIISENAPIITPFNRLMNRIQEVARGESRHGSCGFGIGVTQNDVETMPDRALYVRDLRSSDFSQKMRWLWAQRCTDAEAFATDGNADTRRTLKNVDIEYYETLFREFREMVTVVTDHQFNGILRSNDTVFEGAQGVLLDQLYGFFPHCTRSKCTFENAETLLREAGFKGETTRVGLLRGYGTRHGAGPLMTEDRNLRIAPCHNQTNPWQGNFRVGWFDAVAARYALNAVGGVDLLAITNLDRMCGMPNIKVGVGYTNTDQRFVSERRINPLPFDKPLLTERSHALTRVTPIYDDFGPLENSDADMKRYVEALAHHIDHPVHAYSARPDHRKTYLNG